MKPVHESDTADSEVFSTGAADQHRSSTGLGYESPSDTKRVFDCSEREYSREQKAEVSRSRAHIAAHLVRCRLSASFVSFD
jgi:hypothetical protein